MKIRSNEMSSSSNSKSMLNKIGFVTDIEGNYDYWQRYLAISNVLYKSGEVGSSNESIKLRDFCEFVYGGDICDRGPGDLRVIGDMLNLKRSYPDRVHFILGNRDINKLRLYVELHESSLQQPGKTYWIDKTSPANESASQRLNWILSETMGAPLAFEYRRDELKQLSKPYDDADVAQSFIDSVLPITVNKDGSRSGPGCLTEYLSYGKVAHIINDVLFVHGALRDYNIGWLPPKTRRSNSAGRRVFNPHEWCAEINALAHREIKDYQDKVQDFIDTRNMTNNANTNELLMNWSMDGGYNHVQPGSRLMQYGMGWLKDKSVNPSVIYSSYLGAATLTTPVVTPTGSPNQSSRTINRQDLMRYLEDDDDESEEDDNHTSSTVLNPEETDNPMPPLPQAQSQTVLSSAMSALSLAFTVEKSNDSDRLPSPPPPPTMTQPLTAPPLPTTVPNTNASGKGLGSRRNSRRDDSSGYIDGIDLNVVTFLTTPMPPRIVSPRSNSASPRSNSSSNNNSSKNTDNNDNTINNVNIITTTINDSNNSSNNNSNNTDHSTSTSTSSFTSSAPIHKVVVGHIPRGDAPLVLDSAHGLQVIHGDTSYANNTVWEGSPYSPEPLPPLSLSDDDSGGVGNSHNEIIEELLVQYRQCHARLSNLPPPPADSTRGQAVSEVIFICKPSSSSSSSLLTSPINDNTTAANTTTTAAANTTTAAAASNIDAIMIPLIHGRLSNGLDYAFELKPSGTSYIGRKTHDGWVVKAAGVRASSCSNQGDNHKTNTSTPSISCIYYLLTLAEGFTVRNKLVPEADIQKALGLREKQ